MTGTLEGKSTLNMMYRMCQLEEKPSDSRAHREAFHNLLRLQGATSETADGLG
jgi:hypothetical protein